MGEVRRLQQAGRFQEATRLASAAVRRSPRDAEAHAALGMVHLRAGRPEEALPCFLRASRLAPGNAEHHGNAAMALAGLGRDSEAITAFHAALAIDHAHFDSLVRLGHLLRSHERNAAAVECYRRAATAAAGTVEELLNQGRVFEIEKKPADAETALRQAVSQFPHSAEAKRGLARILRERGEFAEAIALLEQATNGTPVEAAAAYFDLVGSKRMTADDMPAVEQMQALLDYRPLPSGARQFVHFALGKAYDDLANYEDAMRQYDAANLISAQRRPFDRSHFGASVHRMIASCGRDFLDDHRGLGSASDLPVLVLGMPRSGTTLVEQILSSHPDVSAGDELPFWNEIAEEIAGLGEPGMTAPFVAGVTERYEQKLRQIDPAAARVTDKTPGNFLWLGLVHLAFPNARIIHCRRHPVDTCLSNYFINFMAPMGYTNDKGHLAFYYRTYSRMMAHWRAVLPADRFMEIQYEDLVSDPETWTRRMIDFIGLPWDDACLRPQDNRRTVRTASQWQVRQPTYKGSVDRWRRYEPWLGDLRQLLDRPEAGDEVDPQSASESIPRARELRREDRLDEAIAVIQKSLRTDPHDAVLYSELGAMLLVANRAADALDCFERAIGLNPNFAVAHCNRGAALEAQGRTTEAVAALRAALALNPRLGSAYSRLGNLLDLMGEREEALDCVKRAAEFLENPVEQELEEAKLSRAAGRSADAEERLRRVLSQMPGHPIAHAMLGDVLGEAGRFDEAIAHLTEAAELTPDRASVLYNIAIFKRIGAGDAPLLERMEAMLQSAGRPEHDRSLLHFALGKAYDDLGRPEPAIAHFDAGNAIEHAHAPFNRAAFAAQVDRLIEETPAVPRDGGIADERPVFIIGMPRSGTTLVERILSAHKSVAAGGELNFWTDVLSGAHDPQVRERPAEAYLELLRGLAPAARLVTDKNPFNFLAVGLIRAALPRARFIHCRRDPVDTALSVYFTRFTARQPFANDRGDIAFFYRQYLRLMAHWRRTIPPASLLELDYEATTGDPEAETRRLVAFCSLPWDDACLAPEQNPATIRTAAIWQARQPVYRQAVPRSERYAQWLGELATLRAGGAAAT